MILYQINKIFTVCVFDDKELNKIHYDDFIPPDRFQSHFPTKNLFSKVFDDKLFLKFPFRAFKNQIAKLGGRGAKSSLFQIFPCCCNFCQTRNSPYSLMTDLPTFQPTSTLMEIICIKTKNSKWSATVRKSSTSNQDAWP